MSGQLCCSMKCWVAFPVLKREWKFTNLDPRIKSTSGLFYCLYKNVLFFLYWVFLLSLQEYFVLSGCLCLVLKIFLKKFNFFYFLLTLN